MLEKEMVVSQERRKMEEERKKKMEMVEREVVESQKGGQHTKEVEEMVVLHKLTNKTGARSGTDRSATL